MNSKLATTPVPWEYAAKIGGHAILYVTVSDDNIWSHDTMIDINPDKRSDVVSFSSVFGIFFVFKILGQQ